MGWLQEQNKAREDYQNEGKYKQKVTLKSIFCSKQVKGWIFLTIFASCVPILVYYLVIEQGTYKTKDSDTCLVQNTFRVPCGEINITSDDCVNIHCCFDESTEECYHHLPSRYSYDLNKDTKEYVVAQITTPYGTNSTKKLQISINEIDKDKVSVILHEPDVNVQGNNSTSSEKNYRVNLIEEKLMVEIYRSNNEDCLLSTTKGPLIASEKYWEWSFYLTNQSLFGLNQTFIRINENSTFTTTIYKNNKDHFSLPVIWAFQNEQFHAVTIKHDGPLEITILPSNLVILKSLTGEKIELELSTGPTPKLLHDQQLNTQNRLPPYWALETHMCRRGDNVNLTELIKEYNLDTQTRSDCIHENLVVAIMKDNGRNVNGIKNILTKIKEQGVNFLLSIPPHIFVNSNPLYNIAENLGILYKYNQSVYNGMFLNEEVAYPDYSHSAIQSYMTELNSLLSTYIDVDTIDGFILYDNWPVNDDYEMDDTFPYLSQELRKSMSNTLPWDTTINNGSTLHIRDHNTYGSAQITAIDNYYKPTKPELFITSATKSFGQIQPSFIQNINPSWTNLQKHVDNMLFNSIVGNHLVSIPVCGDTINFSSSLQETLCIRWYLVAVTMPMLKISSLQPWRDPNNLKTIFAQKAAQLAIERRNMLLPYYYTLLRQNEPVVRPMFYDYYENTETFSLERQYMVGKNILVAHPFSTGRTKLQIFLPPRIGIWYEFWAGEMYNSTDDPWINIDIVETDFVGFISQGSIISLKVENTLNLIIGLDCSSSPCEASGILFQDNYVTFSANETTLTITDIPQLNCNYKLGNIRLYYYYTNSTGVIKFYTKNDDLCTGENSITLNFENENEVFM